MSGIRKSLVVLIAVCSLTLGGESAEARIRYRSRGYYGRPGISFRSRTPYRYQNYGYRYNLPNGGYYSRPRSYYYYPNTYTYPSPYYNGYYNNWGYGRGLSGGIYFGF